ncbi:hypothetical protein PAXINDRAFT_157414 [Paxillus involutus ATCC 200175]|uniref:Unplaced genomic scaffold PAXINscaffold_64, whole genome shotgun sequence n=1 Tax=Paxillus involutus ATCC 200175 TaxID=664439 RepID=A0A0C9TV43_PAXIN|nr:hypothetical protein PAXINDRAFT_157414 [Paxillus involutus ATCC 200175]
MLIHLAPGLKSLINDPSKSKECRDVIRKMNKAIKSTRADHSARLRDKIGLYAAPNPTQAAVSPPIYSGSKSQLGFNHPVLTQLLCPISALSEFQEDPKGSKLIAGKIDMPAMIYPTFLWEENGNSFDEENMYRGLFRGFLLERVKFLSSSSIEPTLTQLQVMRHIYTGPSTSLGEDPRGTHTCNADLHDMDNVEAAHLAYSCVQARFGISAKNRWGETDGPFSYRLFYYTIMEEIEDCVDLEWKDDLLKHYNMLLFKDENGRSSDSKEKLDDTTSTRGSSNTFLAKMRAQAAARASRVSSTSGMPDHTRLGTSPDWAPQTITPPPTSPPRNVSPPPTSPPRNISPPPTSPPRNVSPDPSVPVAGPSKRAPWIDSELSELEDDALVDISNTKSSSSAKSAKKKKATTKNGKKRAVLSEDEDALVTVKSQTQRKSGRKNRRK